MDFGEIVRGDNVEIIGMCGPKCLDPSPPTRLLLRLCQTKVSVKACLNAAFRHALIDTSVWIRSPFWREMQMRTLRFYYVKT